jgi:hypothetical protein
MERGTIKPYDGWTFSEEARIYEKGGSRARDPKTGKLWSEVSLDKEPDNTDRPTTVGARVLARLRFWQPH